MRNWLRAWWSGKLPAGSRVAWVGDSLMQASHTAATGYVSSNSHGEVAWARATSGARFRSDTWYTSTLVLTRNIDGANCAVQGANVANSLDYDVDEQRPFALAYGPKLVIVSAATNDLSSSDTSANLQIELAAIVDYFLSRGIRVILGTVRPRSTAGAGWEEANAKWTELLSLNTWIRSYCVSGKPGLRLWDPWDDLVDTGAAQEGEMTAAYIYDTVHLNSNGAQRSAVALKAVIENQISSGVFFNQSATNLIPNPAMTGTAGTKTTGVTGEVATSWSVSKNGGVAGNVAAVCSKITSDTVQEIVFTSDGGGTTVEGFTIEMNPTTMAVPDDQSWYQLYFPVEFDASPLWRWQACYIRTSGGVFVYGHQSRDSATQIPLAWSGWLMTEPYQIAAGTTTLRAAILVNIDETNAGSCTMRILPGAQLSKVNDPRPA